ncbi:MAG: hypothetical protein K1X35_11215 [Caulobacteraceae bacterium]|nr:hypothetical protein [Caulobacteraceae bacterium]
MMRMGVATIMAVADEGVTLADGRIAALFELLVRPPGGHAFTATARALLDGRQQLGRLQPGRDVPVRLYGPRRVVLDLAPKD